MNIIGLTVNKLLELNCTYNIDVLEGLKLLEDNSIDIIVTSPPYNKAGLNGKSKSVIWNKTIDYGGDVNIDNKPEDEYQKWQIEVLNECHRVLKPDGVMYYNHKNRIVKGKGYIISPYEWLTKTKFLIRQEITWNQKGSPNVEPSRYIPASEKIFILTKSKSSIFKRSKTSHFKTDVWELPSVKNTEHPAPFPIEIPLQALSNIEVEEDRKIVVLDCFMGSGTTAKAAMEKGYDYIGFEIVENYITS